MKNGHESYHVRVVYSASERLLVHARISAPNMTWNPAVSNKEAAVGPWHKELELKGCNRKL